MSRPVTPEFVSYDIRIGFDLLFLSLSLQQTLISVMLESPQFILKLLSFSLCSVELILRLLPELPQSGFMLHLQTVSDNLLRSRADTEHKH